MLSPARGLVLLCSLATACGQGQDSTAELARLEISPQSATVAVGATIQLVAQGFDANNKPLTVDASWRSESTAILTVDSSGRATGVRAGTTNVVATVGSASTSALVIVTGKTSRALVVTRSGPGSGVISSSPGGIDCGTQCSATFASGQTVLLTAKPASGSRFVGWSGDCAGADPCSLLIDNDKQVDARFEPTQVTTTHNVSVTIVGPGQVSSPTPGLTCALGTCVAQVAHGANLLLTATPGLDATFSGWSGDCTGLDTCTPVADRDLAITATFSGKRPLSLTLVGDGTVTSDPPGLSCNLAGCNGSFADGATVTLTAHPGATSTFAQWSGDCSGSDPQCALTMAAPRLVTATFVMRQPFDFTLTSSLPCADCGAWSLYPGESRTAILSATLVSGTAEPVTLTAVDLPDGVDATFDPSPATPTTDVRVTFHALDSAPVGTRVATLSATAGDLTRTLKVKLSVRKPTALEGLGGLAFEPDESTALVTDGDRLVRIATETRAITKTLASGLQAPAGIALEANGASALVATGDWQAGLVRVTLASGQVAPITTALRGAFGVALEPGGMSALVTDCGVNGDCQAGRLVRVNLATGAVTPIANGLTFPRGIVLESVEAALVVEQGAAYAGPLNPGRVSRISLSDGSALTVASGFPYPNYPQAIALAPDHETAYVSNGPFIHAIDLASGATWLTASDRPGSCCSGLGGAFPIALERGGQRLLFGDSNLGAIVRLNLDDPARAIGPSERTKAALTDTAAIALEPGEASALIADCNSPAGCTASSAQPGRLLRMALDTGDLSDVAAGLDWPYGLVVEPGGLSALVFHQTYVGDGFISRVDLASGEKSPLSSGFQYLRGMAPDPLGTHVIAVDAWNMARIRLSDGAKSQVANPLPCASTPAAEADGTHALVVSACEGELYRVNLATGATSLVTTGLFAGGGTLSDSRVAIEAEGQRALMFDPWQGRLQRVDLVTGRFTILASRVGWPRSLALTAARDAAYMTTSDHVIYRVDLDHELATSVAQSLRQARFPVIEAGGTSVLMIDCDPATSTTNANCDVSGRVVRVSLATGVATPLATGLNFYYGRAGALALRDATHALVGDCGGSAGGCDATSGRVLSIDLTTGAKTTVATGFDHPTSIRLEATGTAALVTEGDGGRLVRVTLSNGARSTLATGLSNPTQVEPEAAGRALVAHGGLLARVDLATGSVTPLSPAVGVGSFALSGGTYAIAVGGGSNGGWGYLYRIRLDTGATDVLNPRPGLFESAMGVALEAAGTLLVAEGRETGLSGHSTLFRVPLP